MYFSGNVWNEWILNIHDDFWKCIFRLRMSLECIIFLLEWSITEVFQCFVVFGVWVLLCILVFQLKPREFYFPSKKMPMASWKELPTQHKDLRRSETKSSEWSVEEKVRCGAVGYHGYPP